MSYPYVVVTYFLLNDRGTFNDVLLLPSDSMNRPSYTSIFPYFAVKFWPVTLASLIVTDLFVGVNLYPVLLGVTV
jgi:hypothetical protein